ncbi:hypothetical protein HMPREF9466_01698 [Fusobacterium necrophorum subsp. funduliforme 1_1_36S]|nr:hypothetical protein HMPREF9466_01698 [Fusobacterium necrophorum subsp. funduliforme 1_1_36S]
MGNFILIDKDGVIFIAHFHKKWNHILTVITLLNLC